jgi:hypothetical protein
MHAHNTIILQTEKLSAAGSRHEALIVELKGAMTFCASGRACKKSTYTASEAFANDLKHDIH